MPPPARPPKNAANAWIKGEADDLASMAALDEQILLAELGFRYDKDKIYTYVGDILVAMNPFKKLPIYAPDIASKYKEAIKSSNPPHIFAIADQAYHSMKKSGKDQCAVVSGESGAGKTESAKYMIQQIIKLSHTPDGASLEKKIVMVNPLLEAFGNAKTVMNNNSSRFGKYTQLKFDPKGAVIGAEISQYLLEKSRVISQNPGERNFHAFYLIFASQHVGEHSITSCNDFSYLGASSLLPNNTAMYQELVEAMDTVGFSGDEQLDMHACLAGILHLGNIKYGEAPNENVPAEIQSGPGVLGKAGELLGIDNNILKEGLLWSVSVTRGETIRKPHNRERSIDVRDALNKSIYGKLFGWMVQHINTVLAPSTGTGMMFVDSSNSQKQGNEIGILDIFGFENFEVNSFEQMCINVTNEQLQNFFNKHIFENELAEYRREGVDATNINFEDNGPLLDMFFGKLGMFALLDEESHFPRATDVSLVAKYTANMKSKEHYIPKRTDDDQFSIAHYAGTVEYTSTGFLEKNRDTLAPALIKAAQESNNALIRDIFTSEVSATGAMISASRQKKAATTNKKSPTVGAQFTTSLNILIKKMLACSAHFIRCIKPNMNQAPNNYIPDFVNVQLSYTGMLETCRIRREGYSYRPTFDMFMERFGLLAFGPKQNIQPSRATCEKVLQVSQLQKWLIGRSKVFLKYWHVEQLDKQLRRFDEAAVVVQKWVRRLLAQRLRERLIIKSHEETRQGSAFVQEIFRISAGIANKLDFLNRVDTKRKASGKPLPTAPRQAPPPPRPQLSEAELKREASIMWWREKERPRGAGLNQQGEFLPWFHGLISRKEAERLLSTRNVGCFLVRVSENRFGYTLSYRIRTRCRHYMVEQDVRGRYALVGVEKICNSLNSLIEWFQRNRINPEGDMLREPCGQEVDEFGEEQCDYGELLDVQQQVKALGFGQGGENSGRGRLQNNGAAPPPISRASKPGDRRPSTGSQGPPVRRSSTSSQGPATRRPSGSRSPSGGDGAPPPVSRALKPGSRPPSSSASAPPMVNRAAKPR